MGLTAGRHAVVMTLEDGVLRIESQRSKDPADPGGFQEVCQARQPRFRRADCRSARRSRPRDGGVAWVAWPFSIPRRSWPFCSTSRAARRFWPLLDGALVSAVNLAEVHSSSAEARGEAEFAWRRVVGARLRDLSPLTRSRRGLPGELADRMRRAGLSVGDRACLALAIERKATVYTTDRSGRTWSWGLKSK